MIRFISSAFLLLVSVDALTKFHFNGQFHCSLPKFQYKMTIWEHDTVTSDDKISHNDWMIESKAPHMFTAEAEDTDDENKSFEVYMLLDHTCTKDGKYTTLRVTLGYFKVMEGEVTKSYNIYLDDVESATINVPGK